MDAVVLAAGFGHRMGSEMVAHQKCCLPYRGRPLISWLLENLILVGVNSIYVVVGHASEEMKTVLSKEKFGKKVILVKDKQILGTASSLNTCRDLINQSFLVTEGDIYVTPNTIQSLVEQACNSLKGVIALGITDLTNVPTHGTIHKSEGGFCIASPIEVEGALGRLAGMYIFTEQIWQNLRLNPSLAYCIELAYNSNNNIGIVWNYEEFRHFTFISDFSSNVDDINSTGNS